MWLFESAEDVTSGRDIQEHTDAYIYIHIHALLWFRLVIPHSANCVKQRC